MARRRLEENTTAIKRKQPPWKRTSRRRRRTRPISERINPEIQKNGDAKTKPPIALRTIG
jgi:hypothetical protein